MKRHGMALRFTFATRYPFAALSIALALCLYSRLDSGLKLLTLVLVLPGSLLSYVSEWLWNDVAVVTCAYSAEIKLC